jgi:hypothetical protein
MSHRCIEAQRIERVESGSPALVGPRFWYIPVMTRIRGYYGGPTRVAPPDAPIEPIQGARAIAQLLRLNERQVSRLIRAHADRPDKPPIGNVPGLGLIADRHALLAWWSARLRGQ